MTRAFVSRLLIRLLAASGWLAGLILAAFTLRRWLFLLAARRRPAHSAPPPPASLPPVLLLVPFWNEAAALPALLARLARLAYPAERLTIVLVDDGSTDGSGHLARAWAAAPNRYWLHLGRRVGKAAALNAALAHFPHGELVAVFDADERPFPDVLTILAPLFGDACVGAVNGRRAVSNPLASRTASHATFENLVHQLVTMRAKEQLGLAPALLGSNCVYRRAALEDVGGFLPGALLEDTDLTLRLARAGWRTHYVPRAVSLHAVPDSVRAYWRQHTRWAAGFEAVARQQASATLRAGQLPWRLRLELVAFSLGYLDRMALLVALGALAGETAVFRRLPRLAAANLAASLLTPLAQVAVALDLAAAPPDLRRRVLWLPLFLMLDMAVALATLLRRARFLA